MKALKKQESKHTQHSNFLLPKPVLSCTDSSTRSRLQSYPRPPLPDAQETKFYINQQIDENAIQKKEKHDHLVLLYKQTNGFCIYLHNKEA